MFIRQRLLVPVNFNGTLRRHENDKFGAIRKTKGKLRKHAGVDLYDDKGSPVKAVLDGTIIRANGSNGHKSYGGLAIIDHTPEQTPSQRPEERRYTYTLYAHLDSTNVRDGQIIKRGKTIGAVGITGNAKGMKEHLHFEILKSKNKLDWHKTGATNIKRGKHRVDPLPYLNGRSIILGDVHLTHEMLQRKGPLPTHYDFKKFAEDNKIPRR